MGFLPFLGLLFIGLKLGGVIAWPWIWVLAPIWGPTVIFLLFALFCLIMAVATGQVVKSKLW